MKEFIRLLGEVQNVPESEVVISLIDYLPTLNPEKQTAIVRLLLDDNPPQLISPNQLRTWARKFIEMDDWLYAASNKVVGNHLETISLLLPVEKYTSVDLLEVLRYESQNTLEEKLEFISQTIDHLDKDERLFFLRLITGVFRSPVSKNVLIRALSDLHGKSVPHVTYALGNLNKDQLIDEVLNDPVDPEIFPEEWTTSVPLKNMAHLPVQDEWICYPNQRGISVQLVFTKGLPYLWSDDGQLITKHVPFLKKLRIEKSLRMVLGGKLTPYLNGLPVDTDYLLQKIKGSSSAKFRDLDIRFFVNDWSSFSTKSDLKLWLGTQGLAEWVIPIDMTRINVENLRENPKVSQTNGIVLRSVRDRSEFTLANPSVILHLVLVYLMNESAVVSRRSIMTLAFQDGDVFCPAAKVTCRTLDPDSLDKINDYVMENTTGKNGPVRDVKPGLVFRIRSAGINYRPRHKWPYQFDQPELIDWDQSAKITDVTTFPELLLLLPGHEQ